MEKARLARSLHLRSTTNRSGLDISLKVDSFIRLLPQSFRACAAAPTFSRAQWRRFQAFRTSSTWDRRH